MPRPSLALPTLCALALGLAVGCGRGHASVEAEVERSQPRTRYLETRETISRLAEDLMWANRVTGLSLALVDGDEIVWATGWGHADVDQSLPAGPRTVYDVGSLSKPITAAAVLQAVDRGELALDDSLGEAIPKLDLAGDGEDRITVEDLLTHQSGLPSDWFVHSLSDQPPPWTEVVAEIEGLELAGEPRRVTMYSNLGMTLAGLALAEADGRGRSYEQRVTEELLRPAGMRTAYFPGGPEPEPVLLPTRDGPKGIDAIQRAAAYRKGVARSNPRFRLAPAGGLRASVLDLAHFARLILGEGEIDGRRLLEAETVAAMLSAQNQDLALDLDDRYGYGWFLDKGQLDWAGPVAWHGGRTYYHHARIIILPEQGLAVAVASNSLTAASTVDTLAVETLLCALLERHGLEGPDPRASPEFSDEPDAELVDRFVARHGGDYVNAVGLSTIERYEGAAWSRARAGSTRLQLLSADEATVEAIPGSRVRFAEVEGESILVFERPGHKNRGGVLLPEPAPISESWRERLGRWELILRPGEVSTVREPTLDLADGRLRFEYLGLLEHPPMPVTMVLQPLDDRRARIEGLARGQGTIVEIRGQGEDERLVWAGREFRRQGF